MRRHDLQPGGRGTAAPLKTAARLLKMVTARHRARLALVVLFILISAAAGVAGSLFLQVLIDGFITPLLGSAAPDFRGLALAVLGMAAVYACGIVSTLLFNRMMVSVAQGVLREIRDGMFGHMQALPIRYFDTHTHGDLMSRYTNDADTLRQMIAQSLPQLFSSVVTIVAVFLAMLYTSVPLTVAVLLCVAGMLAVTGKLAGKSGAYFIRQQEALGAVNGYIEEMIGGQKVVKVFCHERRSIADFKVLNDGLCAQATEANRYANILMPVLSNLGNLQYALIAVCGGALAILFPGGLTLGGIASFLQLCRNFTMPIGQVSQQLGSVNMALAGAERIFALMDEPPETDEGYVTLVNAKDAGGELTETPQRTGLWAWKHPHHDGSVSYTRLTGEVQFFDVDFGYDPEKLVLHDVAMHALPGQKLALVGATGAGKTTVTNLINRFYDLADGKIRYDGININKIRKNDLRRSLGIVLQDVNLFTGTVMENIRYGRLDATDDEVRQAAERVGADGFIRLLPQGYDTLLSGDGSGLSQGQRQLISIARAAVADPPVMILDEATSSIDTRTEAIVQRGMDALMQGRTVFVIAHRLSTVRNADKILVLENGRVIERGSHDTLIAQKGKYYQLYTGSTELE